MTTEFYNLATYLWIVTKKTWNTVYILHILIFISRKNQEDVIEFWNWYENLVSHKIMEELKL